jgi:hypothetical protein
MMPPFSIAHRVPSAGRWLTNLARVIALVAAAGWLAFFLEHARWFMGPPWPPAGVWIAQAVHLLILIGLLASLRWRLGGSVIAVASALVFFALTVWPPVAVLFVPTILPALLFLAAWATMRHADAQRVRA